MILVCAGLAVLLAGADRLLASAAGREVARRVQGTLQAGSAPVVQVTRVPFLTQVFGGVYREVMLTAPTCTIGGVELQGLTVRLSRVRASIPRIMVARGLVAGHVDACATIPFTLLTTRLPPGLKLRKSGTDIGISAWPGPMPVPGTLAVAADGQQISMVPKVLGVKGLVGFVIALPGLPPELVINALRVTEAGLEVTVEGDNVSLAPR